MGLHKKENKEKILYLSSQKVRNNYNVTALPESTEVFNNKSYFLEKSYYHH